MTPFLHLLFIPGVLTIGIYIGIHIGMRIARAGQDGDQAAAETAHAHESLPHAA